MALAFFAVCLSHVGLATLTTEVLPNSTVPATAPVLSWQVRMGGEVALAVEDQGLTMEIGQQLKLFQQNEKYYITLIEAYDGSTSLCAFPRFSGREPSGWVSAEKLFVFSHRARSVDGTFLFDADESVPLLRENESSYLVDVVRNGRRIALEVPKRTKGVVLVPKQQHVAVTAAVRPPPVASRTTPQQLPSNPGNAVPPANTAKLPVDNEPLMGASPEPPAEISVAKIKEQVLEELMLELQKAKQQRVANQQTVVSPKAVTEEDITRAVAAQIAAVKASVATQPQSIEVVRVDAPSAATLRPPDPVETPDVAAIRPAAPPVKPPSYFQILAMTFLRENAVALLLTGLALPLGIVAVRRWRHRHSHEPASMEQVQPHVRVPMVRLPSSASHAATAGLPLSNHAHAAGPGGISPAYPTQPTISPSVPNPASQVFTFSSIGQSVPADAMRHQLEDHGDLSGTLDGHILPQVVQFFASARESGCMMIRQQDGQCEELYFQEGQIVDAKSGGARGKQAAHLILQRRRGTFHFRRGNMSDHVRGITEDTMALLLEVHQLIDEARTSRHP